MSEIPSVIIGCRECERENKEMRFAHGVIPFPTTTAYKKNELFKLEQDYTCPFCQDILEITPKIIKMCRTLIDGYSHIVAHPKATEITSPDTNCFIPHDRLYPSLEAFFKEHGSFVKGIDGKLFKNPKEDLKLIHDAMNDFDTEKWLLVIECAGNPEAYLSDSTLWFNLFEDDL
ncbi:hypothetical protein GCM10011391_13580 [Pullulanibacillus camelliae]|uniref:Uncharacterized protein n=1 Tax=Pullulanibacillus camelliae TaxID=1707096 RepID=A0A8J2VQR1_9BACL|nr:hypothetical protein [Pullulanibacillus camelliae]GGE36063.1 hypothetical protein GCM10011391_13580 [Pullulanibacillus camelliae]